MYRLCDIDPHVVDVEYVVCRNTTSRRKGVRNSDVTEGSVTVQPNFEMSTPDTFLPRDISGGVEERGY